MPEKKTFHIADLLTCTTGMLLAPRGIEAVYDVVDFMTGTPHMTHQLPRAMDTVAPHLLSQLPFLREIKAPRWLRPDNAEPEVLRFIAQVVERYGAKHEVEAMPFYVPRNPIEELVEMTAWEETDLAGHRPPPCPCGFVGHPYRGRA